MLKNFLKNKIVIINIFVVISVICTICMLNQYGTIMDHGYIYPWKFLQWRLPAQIYESFFNNYLPQIFNQNPNDFRSGFGIGSIILASICAIICLLYTKGFFLSEDETENKFSKGIFCIIFPLSLLFLSVNFYPLENAHIQVFRLNDLATSAEYFFCLLPALLFIYAFYDILYRNYKPGKYGIIFLILISFINGYYNELLNVSNLFFVIIFITLTYIFYRDKLKNKYLWFLIVPFIISLIHYYLISDQLENSFDAYNTNLLASTKYLINHFKEAMQQFYLIIFEKKYCLHMLLLLLGSLTVIYKCKNYKSIVILVTSIILSYLLANLSSLFASNTAPDDIQYLFLRHSWDMLYVNIMELCILIFLGCLYYRFKFLKWIILLLFLSFACYFPFKYNSTLAYLRDVKKTVYKIDKYNLVYTVFGETAILPEKCIQKDVVEDSTVFKMEHMFYKERFQKDNYINSDYFQYSKYFNSVYKQKYIGAYIKDNDYAEAELKKRLILLDDKMETDEELIKNKISFKNMHKKYQGLKLSIEDLAKIQARHGKSPILDKAKAFVYFNYKDYDKSLELYRKYLKSYPDDIDALLHIANIEENRQNYNEAEKIYLKLINFDPENLVFLSDLENLYFQSGRYEDAKRVNETIINLYPMFFEPYLDKAMIFAASGDKKTALEYIEKTRMISECYVEEWLEENNIDEPDSYQIKSPLINPAY